MLAERLQSEVDSKARGKTTSISVPIWGIGGREGIVKPFGP